MILFKIPAEKAKLCEPIHISWLDNLKQLMDTFFKKESRDKIRLQVSFWMKQTSLFFEYFKGLSGIETNL